VLHSLTNVKAAIDRDRSIMRFGLDAAVRRMRTGCALSVHRVGAVIIRRMMADWEQAVRSRRHDAAPEWTCATHPENGL